MTKGEEDQPSLLSLVLPSCMVAPVRDLGNKFSFTTSNTSSTLTFELPTVYTASSTGMDILSGLSPDNYDEVRGRPLSTNTNISRDSSMSSMRSSVAYHKRMDRNNAMVINNDTSNNSPTLSYEDEQEKAIRVSKVAEQLNNMRIQGNILKASTTNPQYILNEEYRSNPNNEAILLQITHEDEVINVQLPYNPQAPTEPELWSGSFHPISLHGSIEHFASDAKNIKVTLNFLAKYIHGKQVNSNKVNDLNDFDSMGDIIWNFISSVYASK